MLDRSIEVIQLSRHFKEMIDITFNRLIGQDMFLILKIHYKILICFTHPTSMSLSYQTSHTKMKFVVYMSSLIIWMVDKKHHLCTGQIVLKINVWQRRNSKSAFKSGTRINQKNAEARKSPLNSQNPHLKESEPWQSVYYGLILLLPQWCYQHQTFTGIFVTKFSITWIWKMSWHVKNWTNAVVIKMSTTQNPPPTTPNHFHKHYNHSDFQTIGLRNVNLVPSYAEFNAEHDGTNFFHPTHHLHIKRIPNIHETPHETSVTRSSKPSNLRFVKSIDRRNTIEGTILCRIQRGIQWYQNCRPDSSSSYHYV